MPDPSFKTEPESQSEAWPPVKETVAAKQIVRQCPRCGSAKIIPNTRILDSSSYSHHLQVAVDADPEALVFKDRRYDQITAKHLRRLLATSN